MKKIIFVIGLFCLLSCAKEEPPKCNCGLILDDQVSNYSVKIRNGCSGNEVWFTLSKGDWMNAHPGDNYCITNVDTW